MKITVCHKSGAETNLESDDFCHIEVDGKIVWYPEFDEVEDTELQQGEV